VELTLAGLLRLSPKGESAPPYNALVVKFRPGVSLQLGELSARVEGLGPYAISGPSTPADLVNFGQLEDLPLLLGLALGLAALLTIAHLLLTSVRRRRRDLAVLRALGFRRDGRAAALVRRPGGGRPGLGRRDSGRPRHLRQPRPSCRGAADGVSTCLP
jgi:hypothetical protein